MCRHQRQQAAYRKLFVDVDETSSHKDVVRQLLRGTSILEVGCGGGLVSVPLAMLGASVTCMDMNPHTQAAVKDRLQQLGQDKGSAKLDIRLALGGLPLSKELSQKSYDLVLALEVLEHVELGLQESFVQDLVAVAAAASPQNKTKKQKTAAAGPPSGAAAATSSTTRLSASPRAVPQAMKMSRSCGRLAEPAA